jgi:serine/threonine protein kinase
MSLLELYRFLACTSFLLRHLKISGTGHTHLAGRYSSPSSRLDSLGSSIATYTRQAKTFKFVEIDKATGSFDDSKVLGEGGFGCVYQGTLEDGTRVAVKVLKRCDGQGEREFLAEVEMLGRLHHRNLVKLLGICVEENARCLVYELIPNGSVESHLHGKYLQMLSPRFINM